MVQVAHALMQRPNSADRVSQTLRQRPARMLSDGSEQQPAQSRGEPSDTVRAAGVRAAHARTVQEHSGPGSSSSEVLVLPARLCGQGREGDPHAADSSSCR